MFLTNIVTLQAHHQRTAWKHLLACSNEGMNLSLTAEEYSTSKNGRCQKQAEQQALGEPRYLGRNRAGGLVPQPELFTQWPSVGGWVQTRRISIVQKNA